MIIITPNSFLHPQKNHIKCYVGWECVFASSQCLLRTNLKQMSNRKVSNWKETERGAENSHPKSLTSAHCNLMKLKFCSTRSEPKVNLLDRFSLPHKRKIHIAIVNFGTIEQVTALLAFSPVIWLCGHIVTCWKPAIKQGSGPLQQTRQMSPWGGLVGPCSIKLLKQYQFQL